MKKPIYFFLYGMLLLLVACAVKDPTAPSLNIGKNQLALNKVVAIGNSLTAGFQSSGLAEDFQLHSYPYYIAKQMGKDADFQMPLVASPGIGSTPGKTPLKLENGQLVADDLTVNPLTLLKNATLSRPYDNLGVPGATLGDVLNATSSTNSATPGNLFFDMVLRNPNFGNTTQLQQAITLSPTLILLWIGNNDVLGAALEGGNLELITPVQDFQTKFTSLLTELRSNTHAAVFMANVPDVTDIPYVNLLDMVFATIPAFGVTDPIPVIFDENLQPVDFGGGLHIPLLIEETEVVHLTLPALAAYQQGIGVPDSAALVGMGVPAILAAQAVAALKGAGLNPTGVPFSGDLTLTTTETQAIQEAVNGFNNTLAELAAKFQVPILDANSLLHTLNTQGLEGYSGKFVLVDPVNTAFSLDGVHPNNGGYAIIANEFIKLINATLQVNIPLLNTAEYKGQYVGAKNLKKISLEAVQQVAYLFHRRQK